MTPAMKLLKAHKVNYSTHEYDHDPSTKNFGVQAADKLGLSPHCVFKTLLVCDGKTHYVAVLPVAHQLNLRKLAKALGVKKVQMAELCDAERLTGYLVGGISPLGQKKRLTTVIDQHAKELPLMYVSGGRRGLNIGIDPNELGAVLGASFVDIIDI